MTRDELVAHVAELAAAVDVPLSVDSERCFASDPAGVAETVRLLAGAGAAGCSIEDWDQENGRIDDPGHATELVAAAVEAAHDGEAPLVLTARAENHLHGVDDLDDTIARLVAYRAVGADCVYAPGSPIPPRSRPWSRPSRRPVNVLALPAAPPVAGARPARCAAGFDGLASGAHGVRRDARRRAGAARRRDVGVRGGRDHARGAGRGVRRVTAAAAPGDRSILYPSRK